MKKLIFTISIFFSINGFSQQVNDMVSMQPSYTNQVYYSFKNGEIANISNQDWELAFDVSPYGAAIRTNGQLGIELYTTPYDTSNWSNIDTSGMSNWTLNLNSDQLWEEGAFNSNYDPQDASDLGWGVYNSITHFIIGNKTFVLKYGDGSIKKIWIKSLASGNYNFVYSDLDNSNTTNQTLSKSNFSGKNFGYYSLSTNTEIDREPLAIDWDIVFTKYITEYAPDVPYSVTGVLLNKGVKAYKDITVGTNSATFNNSTQFETGINTIGFNWKNFDMSTFTYVLDDSATYFVQTNNGDVWSIGFTGFDGSSTGNIEFLIEQHEFSNVEEKVENSFSIYPNPVTDNLFIRSDIPVQSKIMIHSYSGQIVFYQTVKFNQPPVSIPVSQLKNGIYIITIQTPNGTKTNQKLIIK